MKFLIGRESDSESHVKEIKVHKQPSSYIKQVKVGKGSLGYM